MSHAFANMNKFIASMSLSVFLAPVLVFAGANDLHMGPQLYEETIDSNEAEKFTRFSQIVQGMQKMDSVVDGKTKRAFHGKSHGCLRGVIKPLANRPSWTRYGIFAEDVGMFPVVVRYSNGLGPINPDIKSDVRGMAIKVLEVPGEKIMTDEAHPDAQDFLMTNNPTPLADSAEEFVEFGMAMRSKFKLSLFLLSHPKVTKILLTRVTRKIPSIANEQFWSGSPYRLGGRAIKFNVTPCQVQPAVMPENPSFNYLRENLKEISQAHTICYNFNVQVQRDPVRQPIEKHLVEWSEAETPSIPVAQILLPPQSFDEPENNQRCEELAFNPWHSLEEHRPLGNMNRARRQVYQDSQQSRSKSESSSK